MSISTHSGAKRKVPPGELSLFGTGHPSPSKRANTFAEELAPETNSGQPGVVQGDNTETVTGANDSSPSSASSPQSVVPSWPFDPLFKWEDEPAGSRKICTLVFRASGSFALITAWKETKHVSDYREDVTALKAFDIDLVVWVTRGVLAHLERHYERKVQDKHLMMRSMAETRCLQRFLCSRVWSDARQVR